MRDGDSGWYLLKEEVAAVLRIFESDVIRSSLFLHIKYSLIGIENL